jgi:hypothetical protein
MQTRHKRKRSAATTSNDIETRIAILNSDLQQLQGELEDVRKGLASQRKFPPFVSETKKKDVKSTRKEESDLLQLVDEHATEPEDELVRLNVGGEIFYVNLSTIKRWRDSMLGAMFAGNMRVARDASGAVIINRSPRFFGAVLSYLRNASLTLPASLQEAILIEAEFQFYALPFPSDVWLRYENSYAHAMTLPNAPIYFAVPDANLCYTFCGTSDSFFLDCWNLCTAECRSRVKVQGGGGAAAAAATAQDRAHSAFISLSSLTSDVSSWRYRTLRSGARR